MKLFRPLIRQTFEINKFSVRKVHEDKCLSVREFYRNKNVFITGATGFLGQGLVETLLRSFPDIGNIYIPIRATKKGNPNQRYEKFLNNKVFDNLRATKYKFDDKLIPLPVSLEEENFGLSNEKFDQLTDEVSVIFHVAALIKFNPPLSEAISSNVLVTRNVFQFGKQCRNLQAYVHVSSLYTHIDLDHVEEKIYPTTWSHEQLIELKNNETELKRKKREIVGTCPGTYFATKKVGEQIANLEGGKFPVAIVRPGKVCPSLKHPVPGWSVGFASYIPWMTLVEMEEVHNHMGDPNHKEELIPVDLCANSLVNTAWHLSTKTKLKCSGKQEICEPLVVNLHNSKLKYLTTEYVISCVNRWLKEDGRSFCVGLYSSVLRLIIRVFPSCVYQTIRSLLRGEKPLSLLLYVFVFFDKGILAIQLRNNTKDFKNMEKIENALSDLDKKNFSSGLTKVDWEEYIKMWLTTLKEKRELREKEKKLKHEKEQITKKKQLLSN